MKNWRCILWGHVWKMFSDAAGTGYQCERCKRWSA